MLTIMLDNASIHRSKATVEHARSLDFTIVWNVPYHPEFNGIEFVWAIVKKKFRDLQLQRMLGTSPCLSFRQFGQPSQASQLARSLAA